MSEGLGFLNMVVAVLFVSFLFFRALDVPRRRWTSADIASHKLPLWLMTVVAILCGVLSGLYWQSQIVGISIIQDLTATIARTFFWYCIPLMSVSLMYLSVRRKT